MYTVKGFDVLGKKGSVTTCTKVEQYDFRYKFFALLGTYVLLRKRAIVTMTNSNKPFYERVYV